MTRTMSLVVIVVFAVLALPVVVVGVEVASEPTPTATATPLLPPPTAEQRARFLRYREQAKDEWRGWNRARSCFTLPRRPFAAVAVPARDAGWIEWSAAAHQWLRLRVRYVLGFEDMRWRMKHPGGSSNGVRWKPLARWVGWPESTLGTLAYIIMRESSGRPTAVNGSSGCTGLLQILRSHVSDPWRLTDPEYNLKVGLRLYREAGWSPWRVY